MSDLNLSPFNQAHVHTAYMTNFRLQNLLIGKDKPQLLLEAIALVNEVGRCLGTLKDPNGSNPYDQR